MFHNRSARRILHWAVAALCLILLFGCTLPKIIVLHDPLSVEEHYTLGTIYESQGKFEPAAEQYREAIKRDPASVKSLRRLGDLSFRLKRYAEAESSYKKAIHLQPRDGDLYNNLCWVYLEKKEKIDHAEELIRTALEMVPEHRAYYLDTMGVVLLRQGRTGEAIALLREAAELLPRNDGSSLAEAYTHLAEAYRLTGNETQEAEAKAAAAACRERSSTHPEADF